MGAQKSIVIAQLARHTNTPIVQEGTAATAGGKQFVARRIVDYGLRHLAALRQGNRDGIDGQPMNKVGRAVQRIDDPLELSRLVARLPGSGMRADRKSTRLNSSH